MLNPPSDPYGHQAQAAAIAAAQAQRAAAEQIQNAGYASQLDAQRRGQPAWPPTSPGVPKPLKMAVLYVVICLAIIFVLVIIGFFGALG